MQPTTPIRRSAARALCALLAFAMTFAPVTAAYGAATPLADVPIAAKITAKPNVIYTLDDSGSMQYNFLPDYVTNAAANISVSLTRQGPVAATTPPPPMVYRARTNAVAALTSVAIGDYVNVIGAAQPEYNGFFKVVAKPAANQIEYEVGAVASTPVTVAAGYGNIQISTSAAYCRSGAGTATCPQQAVAINASGNTVISGSTITRVGPLAVGGLVTATLTNTAANLATISTGDAITITNSTTAATLPGSSSDPYYGTFIVTKLSPTQLTYQITAIAGTTPVAAGGNRYIQFGGSTTFAPPPLHAAEFNRLAYNPAVTYNAPLKADGLPLTNTGTDGSGNYAVTALKWASPSVDRDPFASYEAAAVPAVTPMWPATTKDNLSLRVAVQLYCNTDWPILVNDPAGGASVLDAGDVNGQFQAGKGNYCRINGTQYDANGALGVPAVPADYNYPWQSSSGVNGGEYFYRQLGSKVLWCDNSSPYWPRNSTITGCNGGVPVPGANIAQTCVTQALVCNPTAASRNYTPAACKTGLTSEYCVAGTGGSGASTPGTGSLPECLACNCNLDTVPVPARKCSSSGAACVVNADCPPVPGPTASCTGGNPVYQKNGSPACTSLLFDPFTNANLVPNVSLVADANDVNGGVVCRHNNLVYTQAGLPATGGLFSYGRTNIGDVFPANKVGGNTPKGYPLTQTGAFTVGVNSGCPAVGTTVQIPRHYYVIDKVEFCDNRVVTVNDQWRGFGAGSCQVDNNDLQRYKEVRYGKFTRVDLFPSNTLAFPGSGPYPAIGTPYPNGRSWLAGATPGPGNSESINYANWYAYYSTRLNAAKSTTATAFSFLTPVAPEPVGYRVGFHTLGEEPVGYGGGGKPIIWLDVNDWDPAKIVSGGKTQLQLWYDKLFGISVSTFKTPTLAAMMRIGNLVETGGSGGLAASINPLPAGASDPFPINPSTLNPVHCTNNYHILFTDGKTNQVTPVAIPGGDQDEVVPSSLSFALGNPIQPQDPTPAKIVDYLFALRPLALANSLWDKPFKQGVPVADTLADVATYYWARDLRPNNAPGQYPNEVPAATSNQIKATYPRSNDEDPRGGDVAWWQHVNFNAISFGAEGTLDAGGAAAQDATYAAIRAGNKNWPDLTQPNNPINPKGAAAGAVAVDDLWHATVMGRGTFVFARSPIEVSYGIASILSGIQNQRKSRSGAAFGGQVLSAKNNIIFEPTIEPGWAGDLLKVEINPKTGAEIKTWWSANAVLKDQIDPVIQGAYEPWMDPAHRRIVTLTGATGPGVPFQYGSLTGQLTSLGATTKEQQRVISYLRGGNTWTDPFTSAQIAIEGTAIGQYRKRYGALGDLSNAQPVVVFEPSRPYSDTTDPGYSAYKTAYAGRSPRVIAAANDGMVHVFDTGPMPQGGVAVTAGGGGEVFAFIPRALFKGAGNPTGIQAMTFQDGGVPIYKHHMYVDSSPRVADIYDGTKWRTIVVGGLGKGGNSYYALDVTNPDAADETQAAAKVMWEWSDPEVKYSYGRPVIVKVRDSGYPNGRWVVIVTGGYDNASGKGVIFFLDAVTGVEIPGSRVTTSAGAAPGVGQAAGLAQIHAFVKTQNNQVAEQIYGGDLLGNVWRVDVSAVDQYKSASAVLFAKLDDGTNPQPVTTAPQIEIDINNGVDRYVFIGTGRLLDTSDFTTPSPAQMQTMYAIRDGTIDAISTTGLPVNARTFTKSVNTTDYISKIVGGAPNGWHEDFLNAGERMVVDPSAAVNIAAYVGTMVQDDPCVIALPANLYGRDYTTGESVIKDTGGAVVPSMLFLKGVVGVEVVGRVDPVTGQQTVGISTSQEVPGAFPVDVVNKFQGLGNRISWKLLGGQ